MRIVGYTDRWTVAPGETIRFMVSARVERYTATIVRVFHGDPKPGGPGLKVEPLETEVDGEYRGREQPYRLGSYAVVDDAGKLRPEGSFSIEAWIFPTAPGPAPQGIATRWSETDERGYGLFLEPAGDVSFRVGSSSVSTRAPLRPFTWYSVEASYDADSGRAKVLQSPLVVWPLDRTAATAEAPVPRLQHADGPFVLAGHVGPDGPIGRFNGKLEGVRVRAGETVLAAWDFSIDIGTDRVHDASGNGLDGRTVNMPMRAVRGRSWRGAEIDFRNAPEEYGAIFFHDDDLEDAGWEPEFELRVPDDAASGVYAAWLRSEEGAEDWIPFFVRPPRGTATASIAFLVPTLSYLAYANEHSAIDNPVAVADFNLWDYMQPEDHHAMAVPLLGLYDHHRDGVGVCYSSRLRPVVNMRPHYHAPLLRSAHQFPADLHLVDWLREKDFDVDVVTDEDLHEEGQTLLERYRVVVTGSHPEYWTGRMLDALEAYLGDGGRLMYLGGNGFYWVTTIDPTRQHVIEVRRGRRGTGTWRGEPGEDFHSTTGEPGGLWRDRGRPPQRLAGVGMAAQGFDYGLPYQREAGSAHPRCAWILEGVDPGPIGDYGLVMGGAGALEVDRVDSALGTPPHALLLATVTGFSDSYQHVVEEVASSDSKQGGSVSPYVRGDMVFFETPNGGAVFSASAIGWCGALSHNGYDNAVSRITENVLRRFAAEGPVAPDEAGQ
jgi:N,N-dimethylformamidase